MAGTIGLVRDSARAVAVGVILMLGWPMGSPGWTTFFVASLSAGAALAARRRNHRRILEGLGGDRGTRPLPPMRGHRRPPSHDTTKEGFHMRKVLLVYEIVPDDTHIYVLELDGEELELVLGCHGLIAGSSGNSHEQDVRLDRLALLLGGRGRTEIVQEAPIDISGCTLLVHTGFML